MLGPRIRLNRLAAMCRRLALSTAAGLDDRRIWQRERELNGRTWQRYVGRIHDAVARGDTVSSALEQTDNYFPALFREMVDVGERSGKLAYVYKRLAEHYERALKTQRRLVARITWPLLQLCAAVFVIGLLIWIMGLLPANRNRDVPLLDPTGFGLVGGRGVFIYANVVFAIAAAALITLEAVRRGAFWTRGLQWCAIRTPFVGRSLETLCLARVAWSLHLTLDTDMDLRRVVPLVLRSAGNAYYDRNTDEALKHIVAGREIHEALAATGAFPVEFIESVAVGEVSGTLAEAMGRLSEQYEDRADAAIETLSVAASFAVWAIVALLIVAMIFRLASVYLNTLYSLL